MRKKKPLYSLEMSEFIGYMLTLPFNLVRLLVLPQHNLELAQHSVMRLMLAAEWWRSVRT